MRHLLSATALVCLCLGLALSQGRAELRAADKSDDTPKAAATRALLKKKITVDWKDDRLEDVMNEIKEQVKGLSIRWDSKGGVSRNQKLSYTGKDVTVEAVLDGLFTKNDLGYIVISEKGNAYDGGVFIRKSKERGYPMTK
jgi:hypothetical protein